MCMLFIGTYNVVPQQIEQKYKTITTTIPSENVKTTTTKTPSENEKTTINSKKQIKNAYSEI